MAFIALIVSNGALIVSSLATSTAAGNLLRNIPRVGFIVLGATLCALVVVTTVPAIASTLRFATPSPTHWATGFAVGLGCLLLFELAKQMTARSFDNKNYRAA